MKKTHSLHASTLVIALIFCFSMRLVAAPTLDTSSAEAFGNSGQQLLKAAQQDPDMGPQDKALFSMWLSGLSALILHDAQEEVGYNATPNQLNAACYKYVTKYAKQYEGMTASQLFAKLRADKAATDALEKNTLEGRKVLAQKDLASIIKDWVEGRDDIPLGLPGTGRISCKVSQDHPDRLEVGINFEGKNNWVPCLTIKLNESRTAFSSEKGAYTLIKNGCDFADLTRHSEYDIIPYDGGKMDSLEQYNWFFPKFKEWVKKISDLPDEDKPSLVIKRFPSGRNDMSQAGWGQPTTVWYVFKKGVGSGVLVFDRKIDQEAIRNGLGGADLPSNVLDRKLTSLPPNAEFLEQGQGTFYWNIKDLKLASDIPRVLNEWLKVNNEELKKESQAQSKVNEDAAKQRQAVKKLNLE